MRLFLSYRRDDSPFAAGRLKEKMADVFGKDNVFFDVDSMGGGIDFEEAIGRCLAKTDAVLAIIGPDWNLDRLREETDFVRIELEQALRSGTRLIPILVDNVKMPGRDELPATLARLPAKNALPLRPDPDFNADIERLLRTLKPERRHRLVTGGLIAAAVVLVGAIIAIIANIAGDDGHNSTTGTTPSVSTQPGPSSSSSSASTATVSSVAPAQWAGDQLRSGLDQQRWSTRADSGVTVTPTAAGLSIDLGDAARNSAQGWIKTSCTFAGDFVVSVAYEVDTWDEAAHPRLGLLAILDDSHMLALERYSDGGTDRYSVDFGDGKRFTPSASRPDAVSGSGELRMTRQSGNYTAEFREGGDIAWHDIGAGGPSFADPVAIGISLWSQRSGSERTVRFHDFVVERGTCD